MQLVELKRAGYLLYPLGEVQEKKWNPQSE